MCLKMEEDCEKSLEGYFMAGQEEANEVEGRYFSPNLEKIDG